MKRCPVCTTDYTDERKTCPTDGAVLLVASDLSPGTLIRGKYRIIARLGRGGMGTVYKAEHVAFEEVRALKVMAPTDDAEFVRRFRQEAQAARRLRHPNVVHVDDLDQADDGSFFIVMDYVDGVSLRQLFQATQGPLPLMRTLGIVRSVADALAAAHALGMVHRDIKPENILLARDLQGRDIPKVLDFGIVAMKESSSTQSTRYMLTPAQGSPEQWKGMKSSELDGRADLYALGVVWYEMLTGRLPLHAHTNEGWMRAHLMEIPEPPSRFNPELAQHPKLDALVLKLLAKDREQRPRDAQAFLGELNLIEAQLSWSNAAVARPPIEGDATAMFRPPVREATTQAPTPSQHEPPPQPPFGATSISKTADYEETFIPGGTSTTGPIVRTPAASAETTPSRSGFKTAAILITGAVLASLVILGMIYRSRTKAVGPYQAPCDGGDAIACTNLGDLYRDGKGVSKDNNRAVQLYQRGCDGGNAKGCGNLGIMYWNGQGVTRDLGRAVRFYQKGCDGGDAEGCGNLGVLYEQDYGQGLANDESRAVQLYQQACDGGATFGCSILGGKYENGVGVAKDDGRALLLYQKGCDGGDAESCRRMWSMFETGQGVAKNKNRATELYQKACDLGDGQACANLKKNEDAARTDKLASAQTSAIKRPAVVQRATQLPIPSNAHNGTGFSGAPTSSGAQERQTSRIPPVVGQSPLLNSPDTTPSSLPGTPTTNPPMSLPASVPVTPPATPPVSPAATSAGELYKRGTVFEANGTLPAAVTSYQASCDGGETGGCRKLGEMYFFGRGVAKDENRAAQLNQKACEGGDALGCSRLGFMYENGRGVLKDDNRAVLLFLKSCDGGDASGCNNLGVMYENGRGVPKDDNRAVQLYQKACDGGYAQGCSRLGFMYANGRGVLKDDNRAVQLYQKACDGGDALGCNNLGEMYVEGRGVAKDESRAIQLFQKGCDGGIAEGCATLGRMYDSGGQGVAKDESKAAQLLQKGCEGGVAMGCRFLGFKYLHGWGVAKDKNRAAQFFRKGCDLGDDLACANVKIK